ncbi:MAG TPA: thiamine pyrophosphate-binding protein [Succinivibrionaceae bacterium]|nr:thiamine pyrophosphate-binding protein [Succinivibrionaceae bacterium]
MIRVADYVIKRLADEGIKNIFYVPGGQCVYLMDALRRSDCVQGIGMHHEQAVAMAALSYAGLNEKLGAGIVTTGCAGTNTMTGILHAYQDSIPLIIISGQQNYQDTVKGSGLPLRQVGIQEADIESIMKPVTKYAVTVDNAEDIAWHLDKAIYLATTGRKGPVWVDLPLNVQNTIVNEENLTRYAPPKSSLQISESSLDYVAECLKSAKRPVLLIGNGVRSAGAKQELKAFAHKVKLPVVMSRLAADILTYDDELNFGLLGGFAGANRYANFIVQNSDLVVAIGSRLSMEVTGGNRSEFAREAKIIVVDIDKTEHKKDGVKIDRFIHADAKDFINALNDIELPETNPEWLAKCRHWHEIFDYPMTEDDDKPMDMKIFMTRLPSYTKKGTVYVSDAGLNGAAAPAATHLKEGDRFIMALSQGEMGYALPGACGLAPLAENSVVAYVGDGSLMMNLQELQTVVRNQFNIKLVIINNNGYSGVRHGQKAHFRGKSYGTDPSNGLDFPSYEKIAEAFGIKYLSIRKYAEIDSVLTDLFSDDKPCMLEVYCDPDQFDLHNGLVMYGKRKFAFRPIEDQSPYIDRELFFKEMIVKPTEASGGTPV